MMSTLLCCMYCSVCSVRWKHSKQSLLELEREDNLESEWPIGEHIILASHGCARAYMLGYVHICKEIVSCAPD